MRFMEQQYCQCVLLGEKSITSRRVWNWTLPPNTHSYFLSELSHTLPVYDAVCKRALSVFYVCFVTWFHLVAVLYGCKLCHLP